MSLCLCMYAHAAATPQQLSRLLYAQLLAGHSRERPHQQALLPGLSLSKVRG